MIRKNFAFFVAVMILLPALLLSGCKNDTGVVSSGVSPDASPGDTKETPAASAPAQKEFVFTRENFPRMDGSTATVPLAEAVACVLLGESRDEVADLVMFNRTTQSFRNLAAGLCDILIVSEPAPEVFKEMAEQGYQCEVAPIATDALVFVVNESNPVVNLTLEQIQRIYTGEITNWREVGGEDAEIAAFQRNAEAGSQVLMEKLVMGDLKMLDPLTEDVIVAFGMGELITALKGFDGSANAIGYTLYYYAEDMRMAEGLKIISVDGVQPGGDTIRDVSYPFLNPYFTVIGADEPEDSPARVLFEWLQSDEGQALVRNEGYVSVRS